MCLAFRHPLQVGTGAALLGPIGNMSPHLGDYVFIVFSTFDRRLAFPQGLDVYESTPDRRSVSWSYFDAFPVFGYMLNVVGSRVPLV